MNGYMDPCTELTCLYHGERNRLARELQAVGPDEYPFGYYQHLAADQIKSGWSE